MRDLQSHHAIHWNLLMMKSIAGIQWPENKSDAVKKLQQYMLCVVETLQIDFENSKESPIPILKGLINGSVSEADRISALNLWWATVDEIGIRNFSEKKHLFPDWQ